MEYFEKLHQAIANTRRLVPGYYEATCRQRSLSAGAVGSVVTTWDGQPVSGEGLGHLVFYDAKLTWEPYPDCPNLMAGCKAYINRTVGGMLGVVPLNELDPNTIVRLDDPKGTGCVEATVEGERNHYVPFTVAIIGPEQGEDVLYTFHPGDPVVPSSVKAEPGLIGTTLTVAEALQMGLTNAKVR